MAHITTFDSETGIIDSKFKGIIEFDELKEVIEEFISIAAKEKKYLWLTDYSEASPQLTTMQIYELPKIILAAAEELNIIPYFIKRAIVMSDTDANFNFAQTLSLNRGQSLELFEDIDKAKNWLMGKTLNNKAL